MAESPFIFRTLAVRPTSVLSRDVETKNARKVSFRAGFLVLGDTSKERRQKRGKLQVEAGEMEKGGAAQRLLRGSGGKLLGVHAVVGEGQQLGNVAALGGRAETKI